MVRRSRTTSWAPGRSLLFTTKMSAISRIPALAVWIESPSPGASDHQRRVGQRGDLDLGLADADRLDADHVEPGRVEHPQRLRRRDRQPAEVTAAGHRPDEHARVGRVILHPDPVAEQRAAGERRGRVDGEHARPACPRARYARTSRSVTVDLPTPGEPVSPTMPGAARVRRDRRITAPQLGRAVLDQRDQPGQRPRVTVLRRGDQRVGVAVRCTPQASGPSRHRSSSASPCPPPPHRAAAPRPPPRRLSS